MKKTLAAISAASLGLVGAAAGAAAPAAAALPVDCASTSDHQLSPTATGAEDWYMDCTPLYGLGKAEFTIDAGPDGFPADFQQLDDPSVTTTTTIASAGTAVDAYTGRSTTAPAGMTNMSSSLSAPGTTQLYSASVIVPIDRASLQRLDPAAPLGGCVGSTYNAAYSYSTLATTTSFTQTAGGETWTFDVATPASVNYLYLNFDLTGSTVFSSAGVQCATDGTVAGTINTQTSGPGSFTLITGTKATTDGSTLSPFDNFTGELGTFERSVAAAPAPVVVAAPVLAATGTDAALPALLAAILLGIGASIAVVARKRRATA